MPGSTSLADYISGLWGALGVLLALRVAEQTGEGQVIDVSLYVNRLFRLPRRTGAAYGKFGEVRQRLGADVLPRGAAWPLAGRPRAMGGAGLLERQDLRVTRPT